MFHAFSGGGALIEHGFEAKGDGGAIPLLPGLWPLIPGPWTWAGQKKMKKV